MSLKAVIPQNYLDPKEATGVPTLPLSRVKKTIKADDHIYQCNKQAGFLVTLAAEMFIQHLTEQGVKSLSAERKKRKTLLYKDLSNAVAKIDNLEFLIDVIPSGSTHKPFRDIKAAKSKKKQPTDTHQLTLTGQMLSPMSRSAETDYSLEYAPEKKPSEIDSSFHKGMDFSGNSLLADHDVSMS